MHTVNGKYNYYRVSYLLSLIIIFYMIIITSDVTPEPSLDEVELYPEPKRRKSLNKTSLNPECIQQCVEFVAVVLYLGQ